MVYTIPLLLRENGATFKDLGKFSLSRYPFAFSLFYGFIIDVFYIKSLGKTLTYVIILGYFFSAWMFIISFVIKD